MARRRHRRKKEEGFALLLVFLMAAVVAITLYMELPRYAMERQRDKEQVLIDRGEQYKRAIQLFVAKAKRYPGDIKELESFQNQRFLRHRYEDPMTGKDEWRLVHIQNGILTDSKVVKPAAPGDKDEKKGPNGFVGELAGLGGIQNQNPGGGGANARDRRRTSDGQMPNMPGQPMTGDLTMNQNAGVPMPGQSTMENGQLPGMPNNINPGQTIPALQQGNQMGQVGSVPGMTVTGQPNYPFQQPYQPGQMPGGQSPYPPGIVPPGQSPYPPGMVPPGQSPYPPGMMPPGQVPGQQPYQPGVTTNQPGQQMYPPQGFPGQQGFPQQPGIPGQVSLGQRPGTTPTTGNSFVGGGGSFVGGGASLGSQPGNTYPGQNSLPGQPGAPVNSQIGGVSPYSTQPGANGTPAGFGQPGMQTQGNAAADMIRNILTTPRPGGMPQQVGGAQTIGGGIAGVASTSEGEGIKVYNERSLYQEWEFIFDPQKQKQIPNPNVSGAGGTPADRMNQGTRPGTQPGMTPGGMPGGMTPAECPV